MRYLSIDIEATGLRESDLIIEFAAIAFDTDSKQIEDSLSFHRYVKCPSFDELKSSLDPWVIEHNEGLIRTAHQQGVDLLDFKTQFTNFLTSPPLKSYFHNKKIVIFGKSLNAIDLPFLNRDLGYAFMREHFSHRVADLTSMTYGFIDTGLLPPECESGSVLMNHLGMGEVAHTALEDAINTAKMYFEIIKRTKKI